MKKALLLLGVTLFVAGAPIYAQEAATKEELEEVKGALEGLSESAAEYRGYVDVLRKIKLSGYIQAQFRLADVMNTGYSVGSFSGGTFPANVKNLFQIRRGRLKVTYDNVLTQYVLQIDAIQTGVILKDAYVMVTEPWTKSVGMQIGVFDRPFGYEISYSSSSRETPERSRLYQTLFPGERELGAKLFYAPQSGPLSMLRADVGMFNGSGPTANEFDNFKDIIGHIGYQIPLDQIGAALDLGMSGYFGNVRNNTKFLYSDGTLGSGRGFVVDSSAANQSAGVERTYYGIDAQFYYDLPSVGGTILRFEYVAGKQPGTSSTSTSPTSQASGAVYKRKVAGWYGYLVQNIGNRNQFVAKYDEFDPNTSVTASDFITSNTSGAAGLTATDIKFSTLGLGWVHHWDDNVKFVFYYELVKNEKLSNVAGTASTLSPYADDVKDNVFTFRVQYKF